jgi:ABC-type transport system involved in multi-copper enzyme maturation permease subunit
MKATMAVMAREIGVRRELFLLAGAGAVIAGIVPFLPGVEAADDVLLRTVASIVTALSLGWLLAVVLGATLIGGELADGRAGFFFARPLSSRAIWFGKVAAAIVIVWTCEAIGLLPSLHGGGIYQFLTAENLGLAALVGFLVMPLLLLLLAHAIGIMVRARTAWVFLDLAGVAVFVTIGWLAALPLLSLHAVLASWVVGGLLAASLVVALFVGGVVGTAVGRIDLRRTHGALSLALWATLAVCLAGVTAASGWLRDFGPPEFDDVDVLTLEPNGRWVEVVGGAPKRLDVRRRCLVSTSDNRWISLPGGAANFWREVVYSRDGATAVWLGKGLGEKPRALLWADLSRPDPSARSSNLVVSPEAVFVLSTDGSRLAILEEGMLSVYELADERLLKAVRLPEQLHRGSIFFDSPWALRILARTGGDDVHSLLIAEVDTTSGDVALTGEIKELPEESWFVADSGLDHLVMWTRSKALEHRVYSVYDGRNGALIEGLGGAGFRSFLSDGRMVVLQRDNDGRATLEVRRVGEEDRLVHELVAGEDARISGEAVPGGVVITRFEDPSDRTQGKYFELLDVDTGETRVIGEHLRGSLPWVRWLQGGTRGILWYGNQPATSRLFVDQTGALVRWDPDTGGLVHVVGGKR